jgi:hypothetical protein
MATRKKSRLFNYIPAISGIDPKILKTPLFAIKKAVIVPKNTPIFDQLPAMLMCYHGPTPNAFKASLKSPS